MSTMVYFKEVRPKSRPVVSLELPQARELGVTGVQLIDSYCIEPNCPCQLSTLYVGAVYTAGDADCGRWRDRARLSSVRINWQSGAVEAVAPDDPLSGWIAEALQPRVDPRLLEKLRRRNQEAKEWGRLNGWKRVDWSAYRPGDMVAYCEVFPDTPSRLFRDGSTEFLWEDQYCCSIDCSCGEVALAIIEMPPSRKGIVRGYLRYLLHTARVYRYEGESVSQNRLRALAEALFQQQPDLHDLLRERAAFMGGEFAQHLHRSVKPQPPQVEPDKLGVGGSQTKVGRNDPCPCGSGKKYKKCCLH